MKYSMVACTNILYVHATSVSENFASRTYCDDSRESKISLKKKCKSIPNSLKCVKINKTGDAQFLPVAAPVRRQQPNIACIVLNL